MPPPSITRHVALCGMRTRPVAPTGVGTYLVQKRHGRIDDGRQKLCCLLLLVLTWAMVIGKAAPAFAAPKAAEITGGSNATAPGAVTAPYPTINNLSVDWAISGDANNNGVVRVRYRKIGVTTWTRGMRLRRVPAGSNSGQSWPNKHSGSIFNVAPNTTYEIELTLTDPDNSGPTVRTVTARTRAVPVPLSGAPVKAVTPATLASAAAAAQPGDILNLSAGTYAGFAFTRDGLAGKPIVLRSTADAVVNGDITLNNRQFVYLDGLTVYGKISYDGSDNVAIMRCTVYATGDGIESWTRSQNSYIADNRVFGETKWKESALGASGSNIGEGILFNGPGHVIRNNHVEGFRDNISTAEEVDETFSDDILNNDIYVAGDDGAELDYCYHNCRVMRNRITNAFVGLSSQPTLGGPTYFIRNVMYNVVHEAFKLHNNTVGVVALHNTVVKSGDAFLVSDDSSLSRSLFRNNLFIGGPGGTWNGYPTNMGTDGLPRVASVPNWTATDNANYDAYGSVDGHFRGNFATIFFSGLAEMQNKTTEKKVVQLIDQNIFPNPIAGLFLNPNPVEYPYNPFPERDPPDLRIRAGSKAEDIGTVITNINGGYVGVAPDAGAYEVGAKLPKYGPRS